jgi:diphthine synthase
VFIRYIIDLDLLQDIKVKEPSLESLARGRPEYQPPRFMTVTQAIEQLLEIEQSRGEGVVNENTIAVGLARVGQEDQKIVAGTLIELLNVDFGNPLHSLVIPGRMHFLEADFLRTFALDLKTFDQYCEIQN